MVTDVQIYWRILLFRLFMKNQSSISSITLSMEKIK